MVGVFATDVSATGNVQGLLYMLRIAAQNTIRNPIFTACSLADIVGGDGNPPVDGRLDGNDFQAFLNAFGSGEALADVVGGDGNPPTDGSVDGNDFQAFLNDFAAGC